MKLARVGAVKDELNIGLDTVILDQLGPMNTEIVDQHEHSLLSRHLLPQTDEKVLEAVLVERLGPDFHMSKPAFHVYASTHRHSLK